MCQKMYTPPPLPPPLAPPLTVGGVVAQVFAKLDPAAIARLLQEEMPKLALEAGGGGLLPDAYVSLAAGRVPALPGFLKAAATSLQVRPPNHRETGRRGAATPLPCLEDITSFSSQ